MDTLLAIITPVADGPIGPTFAASRIVNGVAQDGLRPQDDSTRVHLEIAAIDSVAL